MRTVIAAFLFTVIAVPAFAQSTPGIDRRQAIQQDRIEQGYYSGRLSPHEARKLDRGQRRVDRMERRALSDGYLSRHERQRIRAAQRQQNQRIKREKRDWNGY
jgi:hypothetical protein